VDAKYNIATEINDLSDSKGLLIEVEFKTLRGKEKVVAEKFISEFIRRGRTNIFYNFYVCKQIANQAPNLSETATFRTEQIGLIEYLVDFQERRKHYKMKALFIRIEKLKFEIEVEELRLIIAKDIDKFIKLVQSSDSNKNALECSQGLQH
jgi:DNA gyrase/topoisomerase IV subunit A